MYGGANRQLQPPDVDAFLAAFGPGDLLLLQNETSCVDYAIRMAREKGLRVALNPSPPLTERSCGRRWRRWIFSCSTRSGPVQDWPRRW